MSQVQDAARSANGSTAYSTSLDGQGWGRWTLKSERINNALAPERRPEYSRNPATRLWGAEVPQSDPEAEHGELQAMSGPKSTSAEGGKVTREEQSYTYPDDVHQIRVPAGHKVAIQWDHKGTIHEQRIAEDTIRAAVEKAPWVGDCFMCDAELDFRRRQDAMDHFTKHEAQIRRSAEVEA